MTMMGLAGIWLVGALVLSLLTLGIFRTPGREPRTAEDTGGSSNTLLMILPSLVFTLVPVGIALVISVVKGTSNDDILAGLMLLLFVGPMVMLATPFYLWTYAGYQLSRTPPARSKSERENRPTHGQIFGVGLAINIGLAFAGCTAVYVSIMVILNSG